MTPRLLLWEAYEFLSNAWAPIANVSGISKEDLMEQARDLLEESLMVDGGWW